MHDMTVRVRGLLCLLMLCSGGVFAKFNPADPDYFQSMMPSMAPSFQSFQSFGQNIPDYSSNPAPMNLDPMTLQRLMTVLQSSQNNLDVFNQQQSMASDDATAENILASLGMQSPNLESQFGVASRPAMPRSSMASAFARILGTLLKLIIIMIIAIIKANITRHIQSITNAMRFAALAGGTTMLNSQIPPDPGMWALPPVRPDMGVRDKPPRWLLRPPNWWVTQPKWWMDPSTLESSAGGAEAQALLEVSSFSFEGMPSRSSCSRSDLRQRLATLQLTAADQQRRIANLEIHAVNLAAQLAERLQNATEH